VVYPNKNVDIKYSVQDA